MFELSDYIYVSFTKKIFKSKLSIHTSISNVKVEHTIGKITTLLYTYY